VPVLLRKLLSKVLEILLNRDYRDSTANNNTGVAQLVEHWSPKPGVGSSSLSSRAKYQLYEHKRIL
jgi:hypothetical protein